MGNKLRDEDLNLNIIVNGDKGKKELGDLEQSTRKLTERNKELRLEKERLIRARKQETEEFKKVTAEITTNNKALKTNETRMTELRKEIGLTGLTMRQLRTEQTRLKRLMDSATPGTEQWMQYDAQLKKVNARITEVRGGAAKTHLSLGKMADGFNRYFGLASAWIASLTVVVLGFKKASNEFAEFDDRVADIQKTTQLSKEEVIELDKSLQGIDTRTSQDELLDLAHIAGKLGEDTKEGVEQFVRGADKVAVALTEDLGGNIEESVNDIGKLIDIFKLKDEFGLEASIMKVGSSINDLGASGTANEGYIVEFTKRVAGIAPAAEISISKVMGLAATLDQLGQTSEVSSTVYSQIIPDMFKSTSIYANIAGMSVTDFKDLLNKDANEAMIKFLEGLRGNNGGLSEMVTKLDELGLEGKRSISVLGVLANNTELLREQQDLSAQSFENGSSLINEFNIKNTTMQAKLDKSRKNLALMTRELGENLSPAMLVSTNGLTYFVKTLSVSIKFYNEHRVLILSTAAAIAGYTVAVKIASYWDNIHYGYLVTKNAITKTYGMIVRFVTGETKLATLAQRELNTAQRANLIGVIVGLLGLAATAYFTYKNRAKEATEEQKRFNDEVERGLELLGQSRTIEERAKIMKTMNARQLEDFKGTLDDQIKAEEDYHSKLLESAKKTLDADAKLQELYNERKAKGLSEMQKININALISSRSRELTRELQDQDKASKERLKRLKKYKADADNVNKKNKTTTADLSDKEIKAAQDAAQKVVDIAHAKELLKLNQYYADKLELEKEYNARVIAAELALLKAKEKIEPDELKRLELQSQIILKQKEFAAAVKEALPVMTNERKAHKKTNEALIEKEKLQSLSAQKEIEATNSINRMNTAVESQAQLIQDSATALSDSIYELAAGGEDALKNAAMNMIMFALDQLKLQAELSATGVTIQSLAQPDSIATYGAAGIARAGIIIALIEAAFAGAKGLVSSSFDDEYWTGGYTENGDKYEPAGIVHRGEFVNNQDAVQNKDVKQFLDVFDYYQRTGQIKKLNTATILASIPGQQMYSGGYSSNTPKATMPVRPIATPKATTPATNTELTAAINQLNTILGKGIKASINKYGTNSLSEGLSDIDKFNKKVGKK